jgi:hypothetical protein
MGTTLPGEGIDRRIITGRGFATSEVFAGVGTGLPRRHGLPRFSGDRRAGKTGKGFPVRYNAFILKDLSRMGRFSVLYFWLMMAVVAVALMLVMWVGSLFLQSYIYTEPAQQLTWGAPAAAALLAAFLAWWCYVVATSTDSQPGDLSYNTLFTFSRWVEMPDTPVRQLWAVKKNDEKVLYNLYRSPERGADRYKHATTGDYWSSTGVKAIELDYKGEKLRFTESKITAGQFPEFVNDQGWVMKFNDLGPSGIPKAVRTGRFLANLFFNFMHLALWFLGLWLLARFQWAHALGIGFCMWLLFTLAFLPMMLEYSARVAQSTSPAPARSEILPPPFGRPA